MDEDVQHETDQLNGLEQVKKLDGAEIQKRQLAQSIPSGNSQVTSQHLVREWSWNEVEKCWELIKNGQIDGDEGNDEVGEECDDDESEVEDMDVDVQHLRNDEEFVMDGELNRLEHAKNLDEPCTEAQKLEMARRIPSDMSQTSSQHLVREWRIDDAVEKVDDEMESIESSMKRWTWNEVEKCWELMKNDQIDGDEGNDEVGEECDDDESDVEDIDKDEQNVENDEELVMDCQESGDEDRADQVDHLNGLEHESNIEGGKAQIDQRPDNMNTSLSTTQCRASIELLNDQNIEHTNQTVMTNSIEFVPSLSHRHNTIPVNSYQNEHQVTQLNKSANQSSLGCPHNLLLPDNQQQTHQQPQQIQLDQYNFNPDQFYPSSTQSTSSNQTNPLPWKPVSTILHRFNPNLDQSTPNLANYISIQSNGHLDRPNLPTCISIPILVCVPLQSNPISQLTQNIPSGQVAVSDRSSKGKHVCEICGKAFKLPYLKVHMQTHTGNRPYRCTWEHCRKSFIKSSHLKDHQNDHTGELPYKCPWKDCKNVFTSSKQMRYHFKVHTENKKLFRCPWEDCDEEFEGIKYFQMHIECHRVNIDGGAAQGDQLARNMPSGQVAEPVNSPTVKYICNHCGKAFETPSDLTIHIRAIQYTDKPFVCNWEDC